MCVGCVWAVCGRRAMGGVWEVHEMCVGCVWDVCGMCVGCVWDVCGMCVMRVMRV
jgi:hypothetical protein